MQVKYFCPKCNKRWVEWGAQKLDFKCPEAGCDDTILLKVGTDLGDPAEARPTLKRRKREDFIPVPGMDDMKDNMGSSEPEELVGFGDEAASGGMDSDDFED